MGFSKPQVGFGRSVLSPNNRIGSKAATEKRSYFNVIENINGFGSPNNVGKKNRVTYKNKDKTTKQIDFSKPRDLYNRQTGLQNQLVRVNELPNPDRNDILTHIQHAKDNKLAALTIIRTISALRVMRDKLGMPFRDATATDIRKMFAKMENEGWKTKKGKTKRYSPWADKKFGDVIKKFYKVVYGNDEFYPEAVKWIKTKFSKDRSVKKLDTTKFLTRDQIIKLINITVGSQRKTLLAIGYELGARPGELLALTNLNLSEEDGELFCTINESKTNERKLKIVEYRPLLKEWIANHPLRHLPAYPLWVSEATNSKNRPMGISGAEKIAEEMIPKVDPTKKAKLYTLRHSRATFLAKSGWSEPQLCIYFGWELGSDQPKTYIQLTTRDLDQAISALYGYKKAEKLKVTLDNCLVCHEKLYPDAPLCGRCGHSTSVADTYLKGIKKIESTEIEIIQKQLEKERENRTQELKNFRIDIQNEMQRQINILIGCMQKGKLQSKDLASKSNHRLIISNPKIEERDGKTVTVANFEDIAVIKPSKDESVILDEDFLDIMVQGKTRNLEQIRTRSSTCVSANSVIEV